MKNLYRTIYALVLVLSDFFAILSAFVLAYIFRVSIDPRPVVDQIPAATYLQIFLVLLPFWILIFASLNLYSPQVYRRRIVEFYKVLIGSFVGILFLIGYDFITDDPIFPARLVPVYALLLSFAIITLFRQIIWHGRKVLNRFGVGIERIMIIGTSSATKELAEQLNSPRNHEQMVVAIAGSKQTLPTDYAGFHFSHLGEALKKIDELNINTIIQAKLYADPERNREIQQAAQQRHIQYKLVLAESDMIAGKSNVELFDIFPVISISPTPLLGWGRVIKRLMDIAISIPSIIILSPFYVLIALAIKLFDPGPILFAQERMTRFNTPFKVYKFRSMQAKFSGRDPKVVFEEIGKPELWKQYQQNRAKVDDDPRTSSFGKFLRATSLDELPQLFNVLKGDMSLVGPRAIPRSELEVSFRENSPLLLSVKTGITGLAQVSGRSDIDIEERIELDLFYVRNWSVWLDFKILYLTIGTLLRREGSR